MTVERFAQVCVEHGRRLEGEEAGDSLFCSYPGHGRLLPYDPFAVFDCQKQLATSISTPFGWPALRLKDGKPRPAPTDAAAGEIRMTLEQLRAWWPTSPLRAELEIEANKPGAAGAGQRRSPVKVKQPRETRVKDVKKLEKKGRILFVRLVLANAKTLPWRVAWTLIKGKEKQTRISFCSDLEAEARKSFGDQMKQATAAGWKDAPHGRGALKLTPLPLGVD